MYMPTIRDARRVATYIIGPYIAVVLTDCESVGMIDYKHVVFVYLPDPHDREARPQVVLAVAAEMSSFMAELHAGEENPPYFLGVFPGDGHLNFGAAVDWGDLEKFTARALEVAREQLKITQAPFRLQEKPDTPTND